MECLAAPLHPQHGFPYPADQLGEGCIGDGFGDLSATNHQKVFCAVEADVLERLLTDGFPWQRFENLQDESGALSPDPFPFLVESFGVKEAVGVSLQEEGTHLVVEPV